MANYETKDIRNVAFVGHGHAGKTTLADSLLFLAKAVDRKGSVDDGSSVSDFDDEEKHRKFSIDSAVLHYDWSGARVNLIDTPGYPDFIGGCLGILPAVETAIAVISATDGIQVNTRRTFMAARELGLARMIVINKLDGENIDFQGLMSSIQETFGAGCVPFNLPDTVGDSMSAVVSVVDSGEGSSDVMDLEEMRGLLLETAVEADEELMMRYLEGETLSPDEVKTAIGVAVTAGSLVPVLCTSCRKELGLKELLDAITNFAASPTSIQRVAVKGDGEEVEEKQLDVSSDGDPIAQVFKSVTDPFVGKLSYLRVYSGTLQGDTGVQLSRAGKPVKIGHLISTQGKDHENTSSAVAGDIVAVAKVEDLHWGDTLGGNGFSMPPIHVPHPMVSLAVMPKTRGDEQKISGSFAKIDDEDPTFSVRRDRETKEMVINGMSDLHLDVIRARIKRRFQLEVDVKMPRIPYRETVGMESDASYRHKKQSGGRGQFGEVHLRLHPLPREGVNPDEFVVKPRFPQARSNNYHPDVNFLFIDAIVGGSIPNQYLPAIEKGIRETIESGVLAGYVVQDVCCEVYFGKDHPVDSSEAAFKIAGSFAFKEAFLKAKPVILEPVVVIEVTVPTNFMGDIMADMSGRRGRIQGTDTLPGGISVIKAQAPLGEIADYSRGLGSITGGQGSYAIVPSHYDVVPGNVQNQIIADAKKAKEEHE